MLWFANDLHIYITSWVHMSRPRQSEGIKDPLSSSITNLHNDHSANIACSSPSLPVSAFLGENQSNKTESIMKLNKTAETCTYPPPPGDFQPNTVKLWKWTIVTQNHWENLHVCTQISALIMCPANKLNTNRMCSVCFNNKKNRNVCSVIVNKRCTAPCCLSQEPVFQFFVHDWAQ